MKYPKGIIKSTKTSINYGNRGMDLENEINETNNFYLLNNIAIIHKKPTPITVSKVNYATRTIEKGYFKTPSTTDYNGLYKGKYIDFEAKETKSNTHFPLKNIHSHQVKHLESIIKNGGLAFIIIRFSSKDENFVLEAIKLIDFINETKRKSIPYDYIKENGYIIKINLNPRLDYLKIINKIYFEGDKHEKK